MIERFERELLPKERRLLCQRIAFIGSNQRKGWKRGLGCVVVGSTTAFVPFIAGELSFRATERIFFGLVGLYSIIAFWAGRSVKREWNESVSELENALSRNLALVVHIKSTHMVEFEEIEDEGACYAFQLPDDKIVFVSGQDFYPSARFPNSDFEIIEIRDSRGKVVEGFIEKHGQKLAPVRTIKADTKRLLDEPDHLNVINGQLENLEQLLRPASHN
jgi:hypothetical protein